MRLGGGAGPLPAASLSNPGRKRPLFHPPAKGCLFWSGPPRRRAPPCKSPVFPPLTPPALARLGPSAMPLPCPERAHAVDATFPALPAHGSQRSRQTSPALIPPPPLPLEAALPPAFQVPRPAGPHSAPPHQCEGIAIDARRARAAHACRALCAAAPCCGAPCSGLSSAFQHLAMRFARATLSSSPEQAAPRLGGHVLHDQPHFFTAVTIAVHPLRAMAFEATRRGGAPSTRAACRRRQMQSGAGPPGQRSNRITSVALTKCTKRVDQLMSTRYWQG